MSLHFRRFAGQTGYGPDFHELSGFLYRISGKEEKIGLIEWVFWEWQHARSAYQADELGQIGLWFDQAQLIAATPYEDHVHAVALCTDRGHRNLRPAMLDYVCENMVSNGMINLIIDDEDLALQQMALARGFRPTQNKAPTARLDITEAALHYALPEGFLVTSFDQVFDVRKYNRVMWFGFNHGPEQPPEDESSLQWRINCVSSPNGNREIMIVTVAPNGDYCSHCCIWYRGGDNAVIEPVATHPDYRQMGLGRAAVLEAVRRSGQLGAKRAYVGSSQQFYYSIGFYPVRNETFWQRKV